MLKFTTSLILLLTASTASSQEQSGGCKTVEPVENFDLNAYISNPWYVHQQAVTAYSPEGQNYCVRAQYSRKTNFNFWGYKVDVDNYAQDINGNVFGGGLCARQTRDGDSKLVVAPCWLPSFFAGPYWVVAYDEAEGYALISGGQPTEGPNEQGLCTTGSGINNAGLWIFSRSSERDDALITKVRGIAEDAGFDLSVLGDVDQTGCWDTPEDGSARKNLRRVYM
jgi:lipocalin